jgi:hypothetical protein
MLRVQSGAARVATKPCDCSGSLFPSGNHSYLLTFVPSCLCVRFKDGRNLCSDGFLDHEVIHNELTAGGRVFAHIELQERLDYVAVVD